ncbi:hypothetical protein B0T13DRAFT_282531 [Neurospora crassa]|nr:hypothetical protein B0T13DRAFT_282531 [Neurospora crassa]
MYAVIETYGFGRSVSFSGYRPQASTVTLCFFTTQARYYNSPSKFFLVLTEPSFNIYHLPPPLVPSIVPVWSEAGSSLGPFSAVHRVVQCSAHVSLANIDRVFQELVFERFCSENTFIFHLPHCQSCSIEPSRRTSVASNLSYYPVKETPWKVRISAIWER